MRDTQIVTCNDGLTTKDNISINISDGENEVFKPESRITIDGKVYLINRHFVSKRNLIDAVYTVVENDAKRVLLNASAIK
jgi:hypothetical protein